MSATTTGSDAAVPAAGVSIRDLCRAIGPLPARSPSSPPAGARQHVRLLPGTGGPVTAPPLPLYAAVDGVQASRVLAWRSHRPVHLVWAAAGAVGPGQPGEGSWTTRAFAQEVALLVSHMDEDWARSQPGHVPVVALDESYDEHLRPAAAAWLGQRREALEHQIVARLDAEAPDGQWVMVDGSLARLPEGPRRLGVVKDVSSTQYLTSEEQELYDLPAGHLSRPFLIEATRRGHTTRASAFLRLHPSSAHWGLGLIRLEVHPEDAVMLPAAARLALAHRQTPGSGDPRWDRHLWPIAHTELAVGASRPPVVFDA